METSSSLAVSPTRAADAARTSSTRPATGQKRSSFRPTSSRPAAVFAAASSPYGSILPTSSDGTGSRIFRKNACRSRLRALARFSCCDRLSSAMTMRPLGKMPHAHRGTGLVAFLTAGPTGPVGVDLNLGQELAIGQQRPRPPRRRFFCRCGAHSHLKKRGTPVRSHRGSLRKSRLHRQAARRRRQYSRTWLPLHT